MAYVELHTTFVRNRKVKILAQALGIKKGEAMGVLTSLWCNVLEQAETGNVTKWTLEDFAEYAEFQGDAQTLYDALVNNGDGFVDEIGEYRFIHDWWDYAGRYLRSKYKNQNPNYLENIQNLWKTIKTVLRLPKDSQEEVLRPHYLSIYQSINLSISCGENTKNPEVKIFIDYAFIKFKKKHGEGMLIDGKKDGEIVKKLLKTYGLERLKGLWDVFMQSDDPFICRVGHSIGVFKSQINKLISGSDKKTSKYTAGAKKFIKDLESEEVEKGLIDR